MEHTTKMTLVPTDEANLNQLTELDTELSNILKNREISQDDKIKLYNNVLGKYMKFEDKVYPEEKQMKIKNIKVVHKRAKQNPLMRNDKQIKIRSPNLGNKNVKLKKHVGKPILMYTGSDNPTKNQLKWTKYF